MRKLLTKISIFSVFTAFTLLTFLPISQAQTPMSICKTQEKPCQIPPYELTYQCIDKGSAACDKKCQFHKECCEGILVQSQYDHPFECEDGQPFIPGDSACCNGVPYSKSWEGCCDGKTYLLAYDTCCEGRIVPIAACCCNKIIDPDTTGCCNGKPYDYRTQACCAGEILCAFSEIRLTPKECDNCVRKDPTCFYATLNGSNEPYFAQPCGDQAVIVFPEAICPDVAVQICMHPRCGTSPVITGNPKDGYVLEGVCGW